MDREKEFSRYNSGMFQIERLNFLWVDANNHSRSGKLKNWNWDLDRIWLELCGDLETSLRDEKEEKEYFNKFEEFNLEIKELDKNFILKKISYAIYLKRLYNLLTKKEIFLRKVQNHLGKGTAWADPDDDMM